MFGLLTRILSGTTCGTCRCAAVCIVAGAALSGCRTTPAIGGTLTITGALTAPLGGEIVPGSRIDVRLSRPGGAIIDVVQLDPGDGFPVIFQLLYDREDLGGVAEINAEISVAGRIGWSSVSATVVPLDGTPAAVTVPLQQPRRGVGP
ncbi:MAG: hypothetical protein AB8G96_01615 [Phycisphaerales bacterium]